MKRFSRILIYSFLIFLSAWENNVISNTRIDSLHRQFQGNISDTTLLDILIKEAENMIDSSPESSLALSRIALEKSETLKFRRGIANAQSAIGYAYYAQANYDKTLEYWLKSLTIRKEIGDSERVSASLGNIGNFYYSTGDYDNALNYYSQSLEIKEKIGHATGIAATYSNIGNVFWQKKQWAKALKSYNQSLFLYRNLGNKSRISVVLGNIGNIYADRGDSCLLAGNKPEFESGYRKALEHYLESTKIKEELNDMQGLVLSFINNSNYN